MLTFTDNKKIKLLYAYLILRKETKHIYECRIVMTRHKDVNFYVVFNRNCGNKDENNNDLNDNEYLNDNINSQTRKKVKYTKLITKDSVLYCQCLKKNKKTCWHIFAVLMGDVEWDEDGEKYLF